MKEFIFKVDARRSRVASTPNNPPRKLLVWAGLLLMSFAGVMHIVQSNFVFVLLSLIYIIQLVGYLRPNVRAEETVGAPYREQTLVFGERNLLCKEGEVIVWHIAYSRISHIEKLISGPGWASMMMTCVYTNDNDSYMINGEPQDATLENIQREIDRIKVFN